MPGQTNGALPALPAAAEVSPRAGVRQAAGERPERRLFRYVRPAWQLLALTVALGVVGTIATIAQLALVSQIVNRVFLGRQGLIAVTPLLGLLFGAIALRAGLLWAREVTAQRSAIRVKAELRERLFAHLLRLGPGFTERERTGELVAAATEGIERLDPYIGRYLPQVILSVLVPLIIAAYIVPLDLASAALLLVTAPIIPVMMILVGGYAEDHIRQQWTTLSRMSAYFLDILQGLPTLKLFGRSRDEGERVAAVSEEFRERTLKVLRYAFLSGLVLEFMTAIAIALVAVTLGVRVLSGGIAFSKAFLILLLAPEFYRPLRELGVHRHAAMEGKAAADRIAAVLDTPAPAQAAVKSASVPRGALSVVIEELSYRYPNALAPALGGFSLILAPGTRTALVGPSGAGKSTLVNLLLRFMEPTSGRILVNGVPIADIPAAAWREQLALVPQRPYLFYGSVLENIRLARPAATLDEARRAAERAGASHFIEALPAGYDTPLCERGARLSLGQAQRIAIARAFLKDAPLLILDEPTSSLDPESEEAIRVALERLAADRTVLIIAHRLNTIYTAHRIAVLEAGRLIDTGTHTELLARGGLYARLVGASGAVPG